jgi:hypothetical protein
MVPLRSSISFFLVGNGWRKGEPAEISHDEDGMDHRRAFRLRNGLVGMRRQSGVDWRPRQSPGCSSIRAISAIATALSLVNRIGDLFHTSLRRRIAPSIESGSRHATRDE